MSENSIRERRRIEGEIALQGPSSDPFAFAVRATRMPTIVTDPSKPDNPIVFFNDAFCRLTGYGRDEILGRNCRFLQGPETDRAAVEQIRVAVERHEAIEIELRNHRKSGEAFWNRLLLAPVFDEDGSLTYFFGSQLDVTLERERLVNLQHDRDALEGEVERRDADLARNEDRLRFILKAGRLGLWTLDLAEMHLTASDVCKGNFGRSPNETFTYEDLLATIDPEDRHRMQADVRDSIDTRTDYDIEYRIRTPAGERRWVQVRGQTSYAPDGTPMSMAGVSIDITDRKRGDEHRALLAAELDHRVKNTMANIQGIAGQTLRNATTLEDARETLEARLLSLSRAHDVLTRENWDAVSMMEVVGGALAPFRSGAGTRFRIAGPEVRLPPRVALAVSLALHELATNAVKYGALSNERGLISLHWEIRDGSASKRLWMQWAESGGPLVSPPTRVGFGSRLIERALTSELGGEAAVEYRPEGVMFTVEAPLPDIRESGAQGT